MFFVGLSEKNHSNHSMIPRIKQRENTTVGNTVLSDKIFKLSSSVIWKCHMNSLNWFLRFVNQLFVKTDRTQFNFFHSRPSVLVSCVVFYVLMMVFLCVFFSFEFCRVIVSLFRFTRVWRSLWNLSPLFHSSK